MPDLEELKSRARRAEAAGDYRRALDCYSQALEREGGSTEAEMMDPALRLRVADLRFRLGEPDEALEAYRRAADLYARQGLVPNAIAVCNKVLGVFPDHVDSYRRLAELQLEIGLTADARNNLLRYLEAAAERGRVADAGEAAEAFLEIEADQEVAVAAAEILADEGRTDRALEVLRRTWEERTGLRQPAGRIEAFARELDAGVDLSEWKPVWPPPRKRSAEAAEAAGAAAPAEGAAVETEGATAPAEARPGTAAALEEPAGAPPRRHNGARTAEPEPAHAPGRGNGDGGPPPGSEASRAEARSPDADAVTPDRERGAAGTPAGDGTPKADVGAGTPDVEAELRQGLELVEEMLEVAPDRLGLHRRRVRYARRLGDLRLLERALVELGEVLVERGSHRGARFVFEEVRDQLNPGSAPAAEGLRRLDRLEASPRERSARVEERGGGSGPSAPGGTGEAGDGAPDPAGTYREIAADRRFRGRLREALSTASRELAWLHAAAESCDGDGGGPVPSASHELMGRYLLMRDRPAEAAEHLQAALDRGRVAGEARAELLYHLGRAWRRAEAPDRARACFERLAEVDGDFGAAWSVVTPEDR